MTTQNMFEVACESFPAMGFPEFLVRLNRIQRRFVQETKCLLSFLSIAIDTDVSYYDVPPEVDEVRQIRFRDADEEFVDTEEVQYKMEDRVIYLYDADGNELSTYPSDVTELYLRVVYLPPDLTAETETPLIEAGFHNALVSGVVMEKAAAVGNGPLYQLHERIWDRSVREGKLYANREADRTGWNAPTPEY